MSDFHSLLVARRSYRKFSEEKLSAEEVQLILEAALLSPTSKNKHSWEFVVVEEQAVLTKLSNCKPQSATFIADSAMSVVVLGNPLLSDPWIEDASIAAINMQLQAEELGVGSCWVQVRGREFSDSMSSSEYISNILNIPMPLEALCVIAFGKKEKKRTPNDTEKLLWEKIHIGEYRQTNE